MTGTEIWGLDVEFRREVGIWQEMKPQAWSRWSGGWGGAGALGSGRARGADAGTWVFLENCRSWLWVYPPEVLGISRSLGQKPGRSERSSAERWQWWMAEGHG